MKAVVQENGVWIPKRLLKGVKEVEIRKKTWTNSRPADSHFRRPDI